MRDRTLVTGSARRVVNEVAARIRRRPELSGRLLQAILAVGGITFLARLAFGVRELTVAHYFGLSDERDALAIAAVGLVFTVNVVAGSFGSAFVPTFIRVRDSEGHAAAQALFSGVLTWTIGVLVAVSLLLGLAGSYLLPFLGSGFGEEKLRLTRSLYLVLLPMVLCSGLSMVWGSMLSAVERFRLAASIPLVTPVVAVAVLVAMKNLWGIHAIAVGTVLGFGLEAAIAAGYLSQTGLSVMPRWQGTSEAIRRIGGQYAPMAAGAFVHSGTRLVDQAMAAMLAPGSVASLAYGSMVVELLLGVGAAAIGTTMLPHFSRLAVTGDRSKLRSALTGYSSLVLLVSIPVSLVLYFASVPVVQVVFQRGAFTAADAELVGRVQAYASLQISPFLIGILVPRLLSSLDANAVLFRGALLSFALNVVLNYVFMRRMGVAGIALSTAVVYSITVCYLLRVALRLTRKSSV